KISVLRQDSTSYISQDLGKCTYQSVCVSRGTGDLYSKTEISAKFQELISRWDLQLMVISFIPYIEDSVLGLISQDSGLFLKNGGRPFVRQRLSDPSSLTELHLSISDLFLGEQSVKYTEFRGVTVYSNGPWVPGSLSRPGAGGGESNITPHSPG